MSALEITTTRYAIADGLPVREDVSFRFLPDDERSRPQPFHDSLGLTVPSVDPETGESEDVPAPNLWFCTSFSLPNGLPLFEMPSDGEPHPQGGTSYPVDSGYWDPYTLPLRPGVEIVTMEAYDAAVAARDAQNDAQVQQATADWYTAKQAEWDARWNRYKKLGWTEDDMIAEFGARPGDGGGGGGGGGGDDD